MDPPLLAWASVRSGFLNRFIPYSFCSNALIILFCFPESIGSQNLRYQTPDTSFFFFFHFFICRITVIFLRCSKRVFIRDRPPLSRYRSPVNYRSRNIVGNFTRKMNCHYCCHFSRLEFMEVLPASVKGSPFQSRGDARIFKIVTLMENCTGNGH